MLLAHEGAAAAQTPRNGCGGWAHDLCWATTGTVRLRVRQETALERTVVTDRQSDAAVGLSANVHGDDDAIGIRAASDGAVLLLQLTSELGVARLIAEGAGVRLLHRYARRAALPWLCRSDLVRAAL